MDHFAQNNLVYTLLYADLHYFGVVPSVLLQSVVMRTL